MTQQREFSERASWRTHAEQVHSRAYRYYAAGVLLAGLLAAAALGLVSPLHPDAGLILPGLLLAVGFFAAEVCTADVNVGRTDYTISLTAVPLTIGLYTEPFLVVLGAHLLAGLVIQFSRRAYQHLPYNAGVLCLEIAVPFAVYQAINLAPDTPSWLSGVVAVQASSLVSTALGLGALRVLGARVNRAKILRLGGSTALVELVATLLAVAAYNMALASPWGWLFVVLLALSVAALFYAYTRLLREQRDLGALARISLEVARRCAVSGAGPAGEQDDPRQRCAETAEQIREQLSADRVVLHLVGERPDEVHSVVAGRELPTGRAAETLWHGDPLLRGAGNEVRYYHYQDVTEDLAGALRERGAHEALVVPLRHGAQLLGGLEAHDKASRWRGFGRTDMRLLRTIANHLSTAADNQRLMARLRYDAYHDPETGLLNRPGFLAAVTVRLGQGVTVLSLDLDVLSGITDALGQYWGDQLIVTAGRRLRAELGAEAVLARIEGGQFAVLLDQHADDPGSVAERLRATLTETYTFGRLSVEAEVYVGYAREDPAGGEHDGATVEAAPDGVHLDGGEPDADEADAASLLQRADVALRTARGSAEPVREHSPTMSSVFQRRFELVTQFRQAVDRGEVVVYYQPKVVLEGRRLVGFEALARWRHPEFGMLAPDEFVPAVEATGLIDVLTAFVTDAAIRRVRAWLDAGLRVGVSVNLSVRSLADDRLPEAVADALRRHDVPAELLTYEITESGVMSSPDRALPVLRRLHALGVVLSLDDFGTGYSSLAYLRQLPVDEVKIDKSFVLGMGTDLGDLAVVRSIVELGHSLGLSVVAEGVEDDASRDALRAMSCDVAQGYLISRPLPADRLEPWIRARTLRQPGASQFASLKLLS